MQKRNPIHLLSAMMTGSGCDREAINLIATNRDEEAINKINKSGYLT